MYILKAGPFDRHLDEFFEAFDPPMVRYLAYSMSGKIIRAGSVPDIPFAREYRPSQYKTLHGAPGHFCRHD
jgi:hypothetical protein